MRKPLICLLGIAALACVTPAAHAAFSGANGKIAFYTGPGTTDDIYVMQPDGSGQTPITGPSQHERDPAWSPDGAKIAFQGAGANYDIFVMNADGTGTVNLTTSPGADFSPNWSPDGSQIVFASKAPGDTYSNIYVVNADGSDVTQITDALASDGEPAWSPDGRFIAFVRDTGSSHIFRMKPDGTDVTQITSSATVDANPNWSPGGGRIAYTRFTSSALTTGIHTMDADGANDVDLSSVLTEAHDPAWSPDASRIAVSRNGHVWTMNADGAGTPIQLTTVFGTNGKPDWQPLPFTVTGYPRPSGASPIRVPLVPAYTQCTAPNRTHGSPLALDSCNPPAQTSSNLTVGGPETGSAPNSRGFFFIRAHVGAPGPPEDSGAQIKVSLSDVRCQSGIAACGDANATGGADYTGQLQAEFTLRMTDKWNATDPGGGPDSATVTDFTFPVPVPCAPTTSTAEGAKCETNTDALVIFPGVAKDGKRAVWEIDQIQVLDGGPDGDIATADNSLFAVQGLFVP